MRIINLENKFGLSQLGIVKQAEKINSFSNVKVITMRAGHISSWRAMAPRIHLRFSDRTLFTEFLGALNETTRDVASRYERKMPYKDKISVTVFNKTGRCIVTGKIGNCNRQMKRNLAWLLILKTHIVLESVLETLAVVGARRVLQHVSQNCWFLDGRSELFLMYVHGNSPCLPCPKTIWRGGRITSAACGGKRVIGFLFNMTGRHPAIYKICSSVASDESEFIEEITEYAATGKWRTGTSQNIISDITEIRAIGMVEGDDDDVQTRSSRSLQMALWFVENLSPAIEKIPRAASIAPVINELVASGLTV